MWVVVFDIEVRPNRPFQAEQWKIEGKHTGRRSKTFMVQEQEEANPPL